MKEFKDYRIEEDHKDLLVLASELTNNGFTFDRDWKNKDLPLLRGAMVSNQTTRIEANYIRVKNLRYWESEDILKIKNTLIGASKKTNEYSFELGSISDFEEDPGERTWDAQFIFYSHKK